MKAVLVAGDSPVRLRLAEMISAQPYVYLAVQSPAADPGSTNVRNDADVVLIDMDETRGHGLQIIRSLKEERGKGAPVIVALGSSRNLRYRASCLEAGAMFFFNTTVELEWLPKALESIRKQLEETNGSDDHA